MLALSGSVLFAADAVALARSGTFGWKLALIVLALANAIGFRLLAWDWGGEPPVAARVLALGSIALWLTIAALGRMIAYA